jgi:glycosyltransferase involved in cell wall biosynthesis
MNSLLVTIGSFWPDIHGGPSQSVFFLTKKLIDLGYKITIVSFLEKSNYNDLYKSWSRLEAPEKIVNKLKVISLPRNILGIIIYLKILIFDKRFNANTFYINSIFFFPNIFILIYILFFTSKKIIIAPRGELDPAALQKSNRRKFFLLNILRVLFFLRSDIIFHATSSREKNQIKSFFKKHQVAIIDNIFMSLLFRKIINKVNKNFNNKKYFLTLSRIDKKKSLEVVLEAYNSLSFNIKSKYNLYIAGDGKDIEYKKSILSFIKNNNLENNIKLIGMLNFEEKAIYLKNAKMLLFPSKGENFGNVVLEAWSCFCPVVISNKTPWRLGQNDSIGIVVENSRTGFKDGINYILRKKNKTSVENQFNKKVKNFESKFIIDKYVKMFFGV